MVLLCLLPSTMSCRRPPPEEPRPAPVVEVRPLPAAPCRLPPPAPAAPLDAQCADPACPAEGVYLVAGDHLRALAHRDVALRARLAAALACLHAAGVEIAP